MTQYEEEYEGYRPKYGVGNVGAYTYATTNITLLYTNPATVFIGRFCSIAQSLCIMNGGNHPTNHISTYPLQYTFPETLALQGVIKGNVIIENDVWIGQHVHIMAGVRIGNGAIIGAFSIVGRDIPPYAIAVGNPAVVKKYRFSEDIRNRLLKLAWWNWPKEKIRSSLSLLNSSEIEKFLDYYEKEQ